MEFPRDVLRYFLTSIGATISGILYWMSVQNLGDRRYKLLHAGLLSIFLTPFGAWVVTSLVRMRDLSRSMKGGTP